MGFLDHMLETISRFDVSSVTAAILVGFAVSSLMKLIHSIQIAHRKHDITPTRVE